jgi:hypothetical protein
MKPPSEPATRGRRARAALLAVFFAPALLFFPPGAGAVQLDPFPLLDFSRDAFTLSFFREERPSFYWVNTGVPDAFFRNIRQTSFAPNPTVYSVQGIEYGLQARVWATDRLQFRATLPFEDNAVVDPSGNTHNAANLGDVECGATYLVAGRRQHGDFIGLDGWVRLPTGSNPFTLDYPLLSSGKGSASGALGLILGEELGGFSFFQSVHYEKTQPLNLNFPNPIFGEGVFQWPDELHAEARVEYLAFHRAERYVGFFYQMRLRMSGLMEFNGNTLTYGQGLTTDRLLFSTTGMWVRVDRGFSAQGSVTFFPFDVPNFRPSVGWLFSLSLVFRPI